MARPEKTRPGTTQAKTPPTPMRAAAAPEAKTDGQGAAEPAADDGCACATNPTEGVPVLAWLILLLPAVRRRADYSRDSQARRT